MKTARERQGARSKDSRRGMNLDEGVASGSTGERHVSTVSCQTYRCFLGCNEGNLDAP
jgi:hypothetical protein